MKYSLLIALVLAASAPVRAQKVIEKHIELPANGFVSMNFQISDSIRIITWKKNEVYVKSTIDVNDNKNNDDYKETFSESANMVNVTANLDDHCNTFHSRRRSTDSGNRSSDSNKDCCCNCGCEENIYHVIYIPENTDFPWRRSTAISSSRGIRPGSGPRASVAISTCRCRRSGRPS